MTPVDPRCRCRRGVGGVGVDRAHPHGGIGLRHSALHGRVDGGAAEIAGRGGGFNAGGAGGTATGVLLDTSVSARPLSFDSAEANFPDSGFKLETHMVTAFGRGARVAFQRCALAWPKPGTACWNRTGWMIPMFA